MRFLRSRLDVSALSCLPQSDCSRTLLRPLPPYVLSQYPDSSLPPAIKDSLAALHSLQLQLVRPADVALGATMLAEMGRIARERGWRMSIVLLPADPRARAAERDFFQRSDVVSALAVASGAGIRLVDLRAQEAEFGENDFIDLHHVRPGGRRKLMPLLDAAERLQ